MYYINQIGDRFNKYIKSFILKFIKTTLKNITFGHYFIIRKMFYLVKKYF